MSEPPIRSSRRGFLTRKTATDENPAQLETQRLQVAPAGSHTLRLMQRAMACDFSVILNAGVPKRYVEDASAALDLITELEQQMSVYRPDSELTRLNQQAAEGPIAVERSLFRLLQLSQQLGETTESAFDPTSGPLVALWRRCREEIRIPEQAEIDDCLQQVGLRHVRFDAAKREIQFDRPGIELNLGGIGKGYALDRAAGLLEEHGLHEWLLHGGHSSLLARGNHNAQGGWPVGIGNPLFTGKRLGTLVLSDCAMATSGSNIQYFRHQGKKYGHILDPRTGWPVETMLSVTVLAPSAAMADALSTAFYVLGVEKTSQCCDNLDGVGAILIPFPKGRMLQPIVLGIPNHKLFLDSSQVAG